MKRFYHEPHKHHELVVRYFYLIPAYFSFFFFFVRVGSCGSR